MLLGGSVVSVLSLDPPHEIKVETKKIKVNFKKVIYLIFAGALLYKNNIIRQLYPNTFVIFEHVF